LRDGEAYTNVLSLKADQSPGMNLLLIYTFATKRYEGPQEEMTLRNSCHSLYGITLYLLSKHVTSRFCLQAHLLRVESGLSIGYGKTVFFLVINVTLIYIYWKEKK
jgi:hypothetical protein